MDSLFVKETMCACLYTTEKKKPVRLENFDFVCAWDWKYIITLRLDDSYNNFKLGQIMTYYKKI